MTVLMQLIDIQKAFTLPNGESIQVLHGVNLQIEAGERIAIVGRSGSGKSTLLNLLGLLDTPTSGEVVCEGRSTSTFGDVELSRLRGAFVGFVFQQFHLLDRRTAIENVAEPLLFAGTNHGIDRIQRATDLLTQVGLSHRLASMPHLLSGGEKQRVAIARAMVRQPRLLLADEPTGSLDIQTGHLVLNTLMEMSRTHGTALVVVTHDPAIASRADTIYELNEGALSLAISA